MFDSTDWEYEYFYYGNASYPSDSIWRKSGDEYYSLVEISAVNSIDDARVLWSYFDDRNWVEPFMRSFNNSNLLFLDAWSLRNEESYRNAMRGAWAMPDGSFDLNKANETWVKI